MHFVEVDESLGPMFDATFALPFRGAITRLKETIRRLSGAVNYNSLNSDICSSVKVVPLMLFNVGRTFSDCPKQLVVRKSKISPKPSCFIVFMWQ